MAIESLFIDNFASKIFWTHCGKGKQHIAKRLEGDGAGGYVLIFYNLVLNYPTGLAGKRKRIFVC